MQWNLNISRVNNCYIEVLFFSYGWKISLYTTCELCLDKVFKRPFVLEGFIILSIDGLRGAKGALVPLNLANFTYFCVILSFFFNVK